MIKNRQVNALAINIKDVVQLLETIAIYMEIKGENPFKVSARGCCRGG